MKTKKIFLHSENSILRLNLQYLILLVPLVLFGFYKNGIIVYQKGYTTILGMFKPLIIPISSLLIGLLIFYLLNTKRKITVFESFKISTFPIQTLILGMVLPIKVNIYVFLITLPILSFFYLKFFYNKKLSFNFIALSLIVIVLSSYLLSDYKTIAQLYINNYENSVILNPSIYRLLIGFNHSGLAITNHIISIMIFIYLIPKITFKREISLYLLSIFLLIGSINLVIGSSFSEQLRFIFNSSLLFCIFFIANELTSTPATKLAMFFYSLLVMIFYWLFSIITKDLAIFLSIFIVSISSYWLDIIFKKTKFAKK